MSVGPKDRGRRSLVERALEVPEGALLWLPWPSTARIIVTGSFGFLRQVVRSRALGLRVRRGDGKD